MILFLLMPALCLVALVASIKALIAFRGAAAVRLEELSLDRIAAIADACRRSH